MSQEPFSQIAAKNFNDVTIEALNQSASKYEKYAQQIKEKGHVRDMSFGPSSCALCDLFNNHKNGTTGCKGCPVYANTKHTGCYGTPYQGDQPEGPTQRIMEKDIHYDIQDIYDHIFDLHYYHPPQEILDDFLLIIQAEAEYLRSLHTYIIEQQASYGLRRNNA